MRILIIVCFAILSALSQLKAQSADYDAVVLPKDATPKSFADYLVQHAWQNQGTTRELDADKAIAEIEVSKAKSNWLNNVNANVNFSSQRDSIYGRFGNGVAPDPANGIAGDNRFIRPGFNYGVAVNLGGIFQNKKNVSIAQQRTLIAQSRIDQEKLLVRQVVVSRLEAYDNAREILRIRRQSEIDAETNYTLVKSLFEQGKAQFEDLAQASEVFHRSVEGTAVAESQVRLAQYSIEEIVGEPWSKLSLERKRYDTMR